MAKLEAEFLLRHPLFTRRLDFFRAEQKPNEEFSNFAIRLKQLGDEADLQNLRTDELYVFKYVCGCANTALRGKFLKNPDPTLQELKAIVRAFEIAEQSTAAMSAKPQGQQINQIGSRPQQQPKQQQQQQQGKQRGRPWFSIPDRIMGKCSRCGSSSHGKADCKAERDSVTCNICKKPGHVKDVCQSKRRASNSRERSHSRDSRERGLSRAKSPGHRISSAFP